MSAGIRAGLAASSVQKAPGPATPLAAPGRAGGRGRGCDRPTPAAIIPWPQRDRPGPRGTALAAPYSRRTLRPAPGSGSLRGHSRARSQACQLSRQGPVGLPGPPFPPSYSPRLCGLRSLRETRAWFRAFSVGFQRDTARHQLHAPTAPVDPDPTAFTRHGGAALTSRARTSRR